MQNRLIKGHYILYILIVRARVHVRVLFCWNVVFENQLELFGLNIEFVVQQQAQDEINQIHSYISKEYTHKHNWNILDAKSIECAEFYYYFFIPLEIRIFRMEFIKSAADLVLVHSSHGNKLQALWLAVTFISANTIHTYINANKSTKTPIH